MRSTCSACTVVALLIQVGIAAAAAPVNLLANGGFEEDLTGWTPDPKQELVTAPGQIHSGKACLTGEATGDKQALILQRRVPVRVGYRYDFEVWAKATNKTKLVLRVVHPGTDPKTARTESERPLVGAWTDLPNAWRKYTTTIPVKQTGAMTLLIIAPSSHGAPPGRIWIDDVALYETELPSVTSVSEGNGFNEEVAMARTDDGSLYLAWDSFRDGADSLQVARYETAGDKFRRLGQWQVLGGAGTYLLGVKAVAAGDRAYVLYAAEGNRNWDIYAVDCGATGPGKPIRLSSAEVVDVKPAGAWADGTLWVAWEANPDGYRQIMAASLTDGKASAPARLTKTGASNYEPSIAAVGGSQLAVAWHSFRDNNFDVYLRTRDADGTWQTERRLTKAPSIDRHPLLLAHGGELWLLYEDATMGPPVIDAGPSTRNYATGATRTRRLIVTKVTPAGLLAPTDYAATSPVFKAHAEAPAAAFDASGRLWVACRTLLQPGGTGNAGRPRAWQVSAVSFDGGAWSQPAVVSPEKGMDRVPCLALTGDRAAIAFQTDDTPGRWDNEQESATGKSDIQLASLKLDPASQSTASAKWGPLTEPADLFAPGQVRVERGEDMPTPSIEYGNRKLNLYFGDLHDHTDISICNRTGDESVDESYANMRDLVHHDFACATDHGYNLNAYLWNYLAKLARTNDDPGQFLTFLAEEWTSTFEEYSTKHPYGFYGHRNLIFADPYLPRWFNAMNRQTPAEVWEALRKMKANFVQIPHQLADTGNVPVDWDFTDETAQPVAEVFQSRGSYEHSGAPREARATTPAGAYFLQDAWARGIVLGVIASPDHTGGYGKACVYAPDLSRESILDALRARHCYGTTAAKIALDVRVDGHLMGEKITRPAGKSVEVAVRVHCPADLDRVEVCRSNKFVYTKNAEGKSCDLTFVDPEPLPGFSYYYVRVQQKDGEIAWSSPVWFGE
ncbi:MAG: hypothetical protein COZ06_02695 [Armatimonadetes bacterium CG_4_10_14_3_um_filter_66_18]|nr:MAG: hypothetical protein COS65_27850 [Armatimonadetes bacterium CG06_land_8_20_14_3_00_66_21]PIX49662.1 MAG: hypothetical protein COZ57_02860 [Armatimonadetes bacterium CG_4_8_14_3_um_filter_66_20]PIY52630.1 MAG: hypothetical protein COZ06_02695 [Armatimonadetes bacterium CG_4_10_14_3_um_filter_66_18]PIZ46970.1 MAG: hypothetical protein COY42_09510 [Armatimonadetes bacterium CG_4_10_14_0_8_um_filter_66_14]PJB60129.1 MAG: hypothetical protein CO096_35520 [Armatimonadetes bacterium CG_4_9_14_